MTVRFAFVLVPVGVALAVLTGCKSDSCCSARKGERYPTAAPDPAVVAPADNLPPDDQALAAEQKTCPVTGKPLGSMGSPVQLTLNGQPVFVCCGGCVAKAQGDPDATLQKVAQMKAEKTPPAGATGGCCGRSGG